MNDTPNPYNLPLLITRPNGAHHVAMPDGTVIPKQIHTAVVQTVVEAQFGECTVVLAVRCKIVPGGELQPIQVETDVEKDIQVFGAMAEETAKTLKSAGIPKPRTTNTETSGEPRPV
jgi:fructose-1,6-bisphosphatase/sedoheptulose 1,7-bisphosphatase-like protein